MNTNNKSSCWSITINNPTQEDHEVWKNLTQHAWVREVRGQVEQGQEGTPHIQGMLLTQHIRFSQVKKALPRAHIEAARSQVALTKYVQKEDTRLQALPTQKQVTKVATNQDLQNTLLELVLDHLYIKHKGLVVGYLVYQATLAGTRLQYKITKQVQNEEPSAVSMLLDNEDYIQHKADMFIDMGVNKLIREGYYGIETVMCNNQVRNGVKRYLTSILIRDATNRSQNSQDHQESQTPDVQTQESIEE